MHDIYWEKWAAIGPLLGPLLGRYWAAIVRGGWGVMAAHTGVVVGAGRCRRWWCATRPYTLNSKLVYKYDDGVDSIKVRVEQF